MEKKPPKLWLTPKKYTGDSAVVSVRLPKTMLADIDKIAKATGRTRNELMLTFLEFSLENTEFIE